MKKRLSIVVRKIVLVFILALIFPYIKAEYLTEKHGKAFAGLEQGTNMLESAKYHKVISYTKGEATVFYVTSNSGDIIKFKTDENSDWIISEWKTVWSKTGSADNFTWPYYR